MIHIRSTVRVVGISDFAGDGERMGQRGVVVHRVVNDHGACAKDPLLLVRFADGQDTFWTEELELEGAS